MQLGNFPNNNAISLARINPIHIYRNSAHVRFPARIENGHAVHNFPLKNQEVSPLLLTHSLTTTSF